MSTAVEILSWFSAIVAVCFSIRAYVAYGEKARTKEVNNSIVSWFIWSFITMANASSYFNMNRDWAMTLLPATGSIACFFVFCYMLVNGEFKRPDREEIFVLVLGIIAIPVLMFGRAEFAHLVVMITFAFSVYLPIKKIVADPLSESPKPYSLWCRAFSLGVIVVILRSKDCLDFLYPGGCLFAHTVLTFVTKRARVKMAEENTVENNLQPTRV